MASNMTSKELNKKLIVLLPEIKELYNEEVSWQEGDDTGSHVVFSDVLVPYILNGTDDIKKRCFNAIESIILLNDDYVNEVITLSVLEPIIYENVDIEKYIGICTKKIYLELKSDI